MAWVRARSAPLLGPLRSSAFRRYWGGTVVSQFGDFALFVALPFYVYTVTGSVVSTGSVFLVQTVPQVLLAPLAGALVDRWDQRVVLVYSNVAQALVVLGLLLVHGSGDIWIIYAVAALEAVGTAFTTPAAGVLVHTVVAPDQLASANAVEAIGLDLARLLGPPLGGLVFGLGGLAAVVVLDAATFGVAALAISRAPASADDKPPPLPGAAEEGSVLSRIGRDVASGFSTVTRGPLVRMVFGVVAFVFVGQGVIEVMLVPLVHNHLGGSAADLGLVLTGQAIGGIAGGLVVGVLTLAPGRMVAVGCLGIGVAIAGLANSPALIIGVACMAVAGVGAAAVLVGVNGVLQTSVPASHLGRVFSLFSAWLSLFTLAGIGLASASGSGWGAGALLDVASAMILLGALLAVRLLRPSPQIPPTPEPT